MVWVYLSDRADPHGWACIEYGSVMLVKMLSRYLKSVRG
jgi:hypothetical protein